MTRNCVYAALRSDMRQCSIAALRRVQEAASSRPSSWSGTRRHSAAIKTVLGILLAVPVARPNMGKL
jgi:hypothetical protein